MEFLQALKLAKEEGFTNEEFREIWLKETDLKLKTRKPSAIESLTANAQAINGSTPTVEDSLNRILQQQEFIQRELNHQGTELRNLQSNVQRGNSLLQQSCDDYTKLKTEEITSLEKECEKREELVRFVSEIGTSLKDVEVTVFGMVKAGLSSEGLILQERLSLALDSSFNTIVEEMQKMTNSINNICLQTENSNKAISDLGVTVKTEIKEKIQEKIEKLAKYVETMLQQNMSKFDSLSQELQTAKEFLQKITSTLDKFNVSELKLAQENCTKNVSEFKTSLQNINQSFSELELLLKRNQSLIQNTNQSNLANTQKKETFQRILKKQTDTTGGSIRYDVFDSRGKMTELNSGQSSELSSTQNSKARMETVAEKNSNCASLNIKEATKIRDSVLCKKSDQLTFSESSEKATADKQDLIREHSMKDISHMMTVSLKKLISQLRETSSETANLGTNPGYHENPCIEEDPKSKSASYFDSSLNKQQPTQDSSKTCRPTYPRTSYPFRGQNTDILSKLYYNQRTQQHKVQSSNRDLDTLKTSSSDNDLDRNKKENATLDKYHSVVKAVYPQIPSSSFKTENPKKYSFISGFNSFKPPSFANVDAENARSSINEQADYTIQSSFKRHSRLTKTCITAKDNNTNTLPSNADKDQRLTSTSQCLHCGGFTCQLICLN